MPVSSDTLSMESGLDRPWPLRSVLAKLVEAADILLDRHSYDGHGWEEIAEARASARELLDA